MPTNSIERMEAETIIDAGQLRSHQVAWACENEVPEVESLIPGMFFAKQVYDAQGSYVCKRTWRDAMDCSCYISGLLRTCGVSQVQLD